MSKLIILKEIVLTPDHVPTGKTRHFKGGSLLGKPAMLRIAKYDNDSGYYLFHCDDDGNQITDTFHETEESAFSQAEFEFGVKASEWVSSDIVFDIPDPHPIDDVLREREIVRVEDSYQVVLVDRGKNALQVSKLLRQELCLHLGEVSQIIYSTPLVIRTYGTHNEAKLLVQKILDAGGIANIEGPQDESG